MTLSGRRAQAARNDEVILAAARAVFIAVPDAPIAAVAERAGVGISALYRRYKSKEDLLRKLCADGLASYNKAAEAALADQGDPWQAFATFMRRVLDADSHSLTIRLAGTFTPTEELYREGVRADQMNRQLLDRVKAAGALRPDIEVADVSLILEQLASVRLGDDQRTSRLRHRYLELYLDALHRPSGTDLPGPPPTEDELAARWTPRQPPR